MRLTSEAEFSKWLRSKMKGHTQRIESGVGAGIPDINWCHHGAEAWVETKLLVKGLALLRKEQYAWGMRRTANGGAVFVMALDPIRDQFMSWKFPVDIKKVGKYLAIVSEPECNCPRPEVDSLEPYVVTLK